MKWSYMPAMRLVVAGTSGVIRRSTSCSARHSASSASEENRRKSSACVGLPIAVVARGGMTWAQSVYRWDQKAVPQAALSPSRSSYRSRSQSRNACADTSQ
ncbi:MAG: hypothetical protein AUG44_20405 [Actinobacteria bacterium 13_1_20CM_3_71_11]|nr:MAG: hypothetical protein AUG44_20405 [Actinobacteria bacterium 13_1_20CM_3_71_11]